jgi:alpha-tubulin suppressor-like RCC1 family protein
MVLAVLMGFCVMWPWAVQGGVVAWGANSSGQTNVPSSSLSNVVGVAAGQAHAVALNQSGSVVAWGNNAVLQTNVPSVLTNAVEIGAGAYSSLAVRRGGAVLGFGSIGSPPADLTNASTIVGGISHFLALRTNGLIAAYGDNTYGQANVPPGATNIVAIAAGTLHNVALRTDGTVFAWGDNSGGQCNVPDGLSEVVGIAAGSRHTMALKRDGTLVGWGDNTYGQSSPPETAADVVGIAAANVNSLALLRDGTVVGWGDNSYGQISVPPGLTNVVAIAAGVGGNFSVALVGEGLPTILRQPLSLTSYLGYPLQLQIKAAGAGPLSYQWRFNGSDLAGETNFFLYLPSPQSADTGDYTVVVRNPFGTVTSAIAHITVVDSAPSLIGSLQAQIAYPGQAIIFPVAVVGSAPLTYSWQFNGVAIPGATSSAVTFAANTFNAGLYSVIVNNPLGTITNSATLDVRMGVEWSLEDSPPVMLSPPGLSNLVNVANGVPYSVRVDTGLTRDGRVLNWNVGGFEVGRYPPGLTDIADIAGGLAPYVALKTDGSVINWDGTGKLIPLPPGLDKAVSISSGGFDIAAKPDGTVLTWINVVTPPAGLSNVIAVAAGMYHALALKEDGTVVAWGDNTYNQTNVPAGLSNVVSITARDNYNVALKSDGTVVVWPPVFPVPPGLSNVVGIAAGVYQVYALRNDGTVVGFSYSSASNPPPAGLSNVVQIASNDSLPRCSAIAGFIAPFLNRRPLSATLAAGASHTFRVGVTGSFPLSYQWRFNGNDVTGATTSALPLQNLGPANVGNYSVVVTNAYGAVTSDVAVLTLTPLLRQPVRNGNSFSMQALTLPSQTYEFEYKNSLDDPNWSSLLRFYGEGAWQLLTDTNASGPERFYRVRQDVLSCVPAPANLVSSWRADYSGADAVSTNNGTVTSNATYAVGVVGAAFVFDGISAGVSLGNRPGLQLQNFTIECWVKRADPTLATANGESGGSFFGWNIGGYGFGVYNDGRLNLTKIAYTVVNTTPILVDTNYHHVAVTKSGSTVVFYLDGVAYPVGAYDPGFTFSDVAAIGARGDLTHSFLGRIDEISIYGRALSAAELQSIYNAGSAGKCFGP